MAAVKWSYGYTFLPKLVNPIVQLFLARLLLPADFGLIAIAMSVVTFAETIREAGFSRAFIQKGNTEDDPLFFSTVFWLSLGTGLCLYLSIFVTAPMISTFFNKSESLWVIRIIAIQMILSSLNTCHNSTMIKNFEYSKLFMANILPAMIPLFVTIPLAYIGFDVWALVIGYLTSSALKTYVSWLLVPLRPKLEFKASVAKQILHFGTMCSTEAVLGWFYVWGDKVIVGHFLGATQLGLYSIASMIVLFIFDSIFSPLSVSYPLLCGLKDNIDAVRSVLYKLIHLVSTVSLLIAIIIVLNVGLIPFFIGPKWIGIELPVGILAVAQSLSYIVTISVPNALRAINKPAVMPKLQSLKLIYTLPAFIFASKYFGLIGFCFAKLATVFLGVIIYFLIAVKVLGVTWKLTVNTIYWKIMAVAVTVAVLFLFESTGFLRGGNHIYLPCIVNTGIAISVYFATLLLVDRKSIADMVQLSMRIIGLKRRN